MVAEGSADHLKLFLQQKRGLGNQLFQYAAMLYFANFYRADVEIVMEPTKQSWSAGRPRPCLLSKFSLPVPIRRSTLRYRTALFAAQRSLSKVFGVDHYRQPNCDTWLFLPTLPIMSAARYVYVEGFFESYHYPNAIETTLRNDLLFKEGPIGRNLDCLSAIRNCDISVSVHLRRGDYAVEFSGENLLPVSYYRNAIEAARESLNPSKFFVFSDDIEFARTHLGSDEDMVFVDHNGEAEAHEDLRLMAACDHHIIANSTFSWWGAWLNPSKEKLVFAPDRWRKHNYPREPEIIPPNWIRIPVDATVV